MPLSLICNSTYLDEKNVSRKCGQIEPYMDPKTEKVFCPLCDGEIPNVSHFTKITLKNLRQFRQKQPVPFSVKCQKCDKEGQPRIINDEVVCPKCLEPHAHLSEPFKIMLKDKLKTANKDI